MPLFAFEGIAPTVHPDAFVAPTATLVGDVRVEANASIWYNAVLRADFGPIVIREGANVQDGCVLHGGTEPVTEVGVGATIGHLCVVHGAVIGTEALVGNGATVQDGARIGARCLIGAGATIPPNTVVPDGQLVLDTVARVKGPLSASAKGWVDSNPDIYRELARRHRESVVPVVPSDTRA
ncbi:gamma carbonic anhydrase family protein [Pseudonocardia humida]|uniref:Gamma carbonic anhydrase family protein n=1 Tax=Pseudonocardia humida TaxID=2800819 RepID=A0ABT0ZWM9_9PSEU|nr:gamma carbonic anhydrase family protein [Pseudonocardia humida]MCO1655085.1 gamma carbonic anhydrase family protein [Pseudonocardia humida]